jgi:hypothetical protein
MPTTITYNRGAIVLLPFPFSVDPSFAKRAVTSVSSGLVRKQLGELRQADAVKLDEALRRWFGL